MCMVSPQEGMNSSYTSQSLDSSHASPCTSTACYEVAGTPTVYPYNDAALLETSSAYSSMETLHQEYPASSCPTVSCTVSQFKVPHYSWYPASNYPHNTPFPPSSPIPYYMSTHSAGPDVPTSHSCCQPAPYIDFWSSTTQVAME